MKLSSLALLLACVTATPALAAPGDILRPGSFEWAHRSNAEDLAAVYPDRAMREGRGGWAVMACAALEDGTLSGCRVGAEAPGGDGFGEAVLKVAPQFRLKPSLPAGGSVAGSIVQIPLVWKFPGGATPPQTFKPGSPGMLVEALAPGASGGPRSFACPTAAAPSRKCQTHLLDWAQAPLASDLSGLASRAGGGASLIECVVGDAGVLGQCKVGGDAPPELDAELLTLAGQFRAPPATADRKKTLGERVVLAFDWKVLGAIVAAHEAVKAAQQAP